MYIKSRVFSYAIERQNGYNQMFVPRNGNHFHHNTRAVRLAYILSTDPTFSIIVAFRIPTIVCTSYVNKHSRSPRIFSGTAAISTDTKSCKWVRKWRESFDARHASCMSPVIVDACTLVLLKMRHIFSRPQMLMPFTLTPEITHAHTVISVCCINLQTCQFVMTFLCECV